MLLGDIKTAGNLDYALTAETLKTNIQAQLYAMAIMFEENVNELDAVWFYTKTRKPYRSPRAHVRLDAALVVGQFQKIDASGDRLVTTRLANPKVDELRPNPRMCESYGGCPYRYKCNLSPTVHAAAVNQEAVKMNPDFLSNLRKSVAGAQPAPPPAAPVLPPAPPPAAPMHPTHSFEVPAATRGACMGSSPRRARGAAREHASRRDQSAGVGATARAARERGAARRHGRRPHGRRRTEAASRAPCEGRDRRRRRYADRGAARPRRRDARLLGVNRLTMSDGPESNEVSLPGFPVSS